MSQPQDYGAPRTETFDVVMLKKGVAEHAAKPADFLRVRLTSESAYAARSEKEVTAAEAKGFVLLKVTGPGQTTHEEHQATLRAYEAANGGPLDRTKI